MSDVINTVKNHGFTLIELLVVIAIITGLSTVSIMSTTDDVNQNRVKQVAYEFKNSVALARSEAILKGKHVRLRRIDQTSEGLGWNDIDIGWHIIHQKHGNPTAIFKYGVSFDLDVAGEAHDGLVFLKNTGELWSDDSSEKVCFTGGGITYSVEVSSLGIATVDASGSCT